jgi:hypothetical protein
MEISLAFGGIDSFHQNICPDGDDSTIVYNLLGNHFFDDVYGNNPYYRKYWHGLILYESSSCPHDKRYCLEISRLMGLIHFSLGKRAKSD